MRVLLAVGEPNMTSIIKSHLVENGFDVIDQIIVHRKYLQEAIELEKPEMVIIHDTYLQSSFEDPNERDQEMLRMIDQWRLQFDDQLRVVYLCERNRNDRFLGALVARNVMDIFYQRTIPTQLFIKQLLEPPKFSNVAHLGVEDLDLTKLEIHELNKGQKDDSTPSEQNMQPDEEKKSLKKPREIFKPTNIQIQVNKPSKIQRVGYALDRKIIVVISPFERTGSTFIAHQLAYQIASHHIGVTYFENPYRRPYTYDRFGGHLELPEYRSLYMRQINPLLDKDIPRKWEVQGVSIQALNPKYEMPYQEEDISIEDFLRLFLSTGDTPVLIVDIGSDKQRSVYNQLLEIASHILVVVDSDIPNLEWFEQNQLSSDYSWIHRAMRSDKALLIANRFTKHAEQVLPMKQFHPIPTFDDEWVFESQVQGVFAINQREYLKALNHAFADILKKLIDPSYLEVKKEGFSFKNLLPQIIFVKNKEAPRDVAIEKKNI